jgi:hypothetical protein
MGIRAGTGFIRAGDALTLYWLTPSFPNVVNTS